MEVDERVLRHLQTLARLIYEVNRDDSSEASQQNLYGDLSTAFRDAAERHVGPDLANELIERMVDCGWVGEDVAKVLKDIEDENTAHGVVERVRRGEVDVHWDDTGRETTCRVAPGDWPRAPKVGDRVIETTKDREEKFCRPAPAPTQPASPEPLIDMEERAHGL
jgi:predicted DNA-binding protein